METIFQHQDPNFIANTLQLELNTIYNILAPEKIVQYKSNHVPYYSQDNYAKIDHCNELLTKAISSKDKSDWRNFRNTKNILDKEIKQLISNYISNRMTDTKNDWKFLQQHNKCIKSRPPDKLNINGNLITNPREIANIVNNFLFQKLKRY